MEILQRAIQAVQRNLPVLALYLLVTTTADAAGIAIWQALGPPDKSSLPKTALFLCGIGVDVCLVLVYAAAQAVAFSRFAKDIDRPLWRIGGDSEALKRYFPLWLALNAGLYALKQLSFDVPAYLENDKIGLISIWLLLVASAVCIPLGAAMMFMHTADWRNIGEALAPYRRQLGKAIALCCVNGFLFVFALSLVAHTEDQRWLGLPLDIIFGYFDCVIFCSAWYICILDRQTPQDIDFDF